MTLEGFEFNGEDAISTTLSGIRTLIGVLLGLGFITVTKSSLKQHEDLKVGTSVGVNTHRVLLVILVMTLHSFSEGVGIDVSFRGSNGIKLEVGGASVSASGAYGASGVSGVNGTSGTSGASGTSVSGARGASESASASGASTSGASASGASTSGVSASGESASGTNVSGASASGTSASGASASGASASGAKKS